MIKYNLIFAFPVKPTYGTRWVLESYRRNSNFWTKVSLEIYSGITGFFVLVELIGRFRDLQFLKHLLIDVSQLLGFVRKKFFETYWEELIVIVGTGYRVSIDELSDRRLELGFSHTLIYKNLGVAMAVLSSQPLGLKVYSSGLGSRGRVIAAVGFRENYRPRSVYTGCGIIRLGHYPKLKPTKPLV